MAYVPRRYDNYDVRTPSRQTKGKSGLPQVIRSGCAMTPDARRAGQSLETKLPGESEDGKISPCFPCSADWPNLLEVIAMHTRHALNNVLILLRVLKAIIVREKRTTIAEQLSFSSR